MPEAVVFTLCAAALACVLAAALAARRRRAAVDAPPEPEPERHFVTGRYFIVRDRPWWAVCEDGPEGPRVVDECAMLSTAMRRVRRLDELARGKP